MCSLFLSGWSPQLGIESSEAFLWTLTNYESSTELLNHSVDIATTLSRSDALSGLVKFNFATNSYFMVNSTITFEWLAGTPQSIKDSLSSSFNPALAEPELLICDYASYLQILQQETILSDSFCQSPLNSPELCERYSSSLDRTYSSNEIAKYTLEIRGVARKDTGSRYFLVSACAFVDAFENPSITRMHISADVTLQKSDTVENSRQIENLIRVSLVSLVGLSCVSLAGYKLYIRRWRSERNTEIQSRLFLIGIFKVCTLVLGLAQISIPNKHSIDTSPSVMAVDYLYMIFLATFCTSLLSLVLELALGKLITRRHLSLADNFKAKKLTVLFGLSLFLYLLWGRSLFAWIILCIVYVIIISSAHFLVASTVRGLQHQSQCIQAQLDTAGRSNDVPANVLDLLVRRQKFVDDIAETFTSLRMTMVFFFCFAPFLLLIVQITMVKLTGSKFVLVTLSEFIDLLFLIRLAYILRFRALDIYLPEGDAIEAIATRASSSLSGTTVSATSVFPLVDEESIRVGCESSGQSSGSNELVLNLRNEKVDKGAVTTAVICIEMPDETLRIGLLDKYSL